MIDSHANMVVLGKNSFIFESTGCTCNVKPFDSALGTAANIPIVDGHTAKTYILIVWNALYIPWLSNNLIPLFVMREGGVIVNKVLKIHCDDPTEEDHSISLPDSSLQIPLQLTGIFSYFPSRNPEEKELFECKKLFLTPDVNGWNLYCISFALNEQSMLNFRGDISEKSRWLKDPQIFENKDDGVIHEISKVTAEEWDWQVDANISSAFACCSEYNDADDGFAAAVNARAKTSKFSSPIENCAFADLGGTNNLFYMDVPLTINWDNFKELLEAMLTLAQISIVKAQMASAEALKPKEVLVLLLSKLWMVKEPLAEGAIEQNTQLCCQSSDNFMSR